MKISDLNQLDFNNVGKWPMPTKVAAIAIVCIIVLAAGYWFDTQEQVKVLGQAEEKEKELKVVAKKLKKEFKVEKQRQYKLSNKKK